MYEVVANLDEVTEAEWLALRKEGIGASEAAVAVGVSPWKSPMRLFLEKTGAIEPEVVDSEAVYWGQKLEASILSRFQELHPDAELRPTKALLRSKEFPFMLATPDSMGTYKGEKAVIEVKSTGHYGAAQWEGDEVPINYVLQGAHQLAVTGYALVIYPVLIAGQRYVERIIERDDSLIEPMVATTSATTAPPRLAMPAAVMASWLAWRKGRVMPVVSSHEHSMPKPTANSVNERMMRDRRELIRRMREISSELGMDPAYPLMIGLELRDPRGNILERRSEPGHSWTRNAWNMLMAFMGDAGASGASFGAGYMQCAVAQVDGHVQAFFQQLNVAVIQSKQRNAGIKRV